MAEIALDWHPEALAEAEAAAIWYGARNQRAAAEFLAEIDYAVEQIATAPKRWPRGIRGTRRYLLRRFPYAVVYRERHAAIEVVAVAHARRHPDYWRSR